MLKRRIHMLSAALLCALPLFAYADILVNNHTDSFGTGKIGIGPCSSSIGDQGIVHPHSTFNVPQSVLDLVCGVMTCQASVFLSKDCSGKQLATVTLDAKRGVIAVNNMDPAHYHISGGGNNMTLDPVSNGWKDFFHLS